MLSICRRQNPLPEDDVPVFQKFWKSQRAKVRCTLWGNWFGVWLWLGSSSFNWLHVPVQCMFMHVQVEWDNCLGSVCYNRTLQVGLFTAKVIVWLKFFPTAVYSFRILRSSCFCMYSAAQCMCLWGTYCSGFFSSYETIPKIHEALVRRSCADGRLADLSWRIDVKSKARHVDQINQPTAIVEMEISQQSGTVRKSRLPILYTEHCTWHGSLLIFDTCFGHCLVGHTFC